MEFFNDAGVDPYKPSIFELIAQEQLRDLLQPALKYILAFFAQRNPRYLLRIVNKHEEFYAVIMLFVERHYLRAHNASFAENFYGLMRRKTPQYETPRADTALGRVANAEKLQPVDMRKSLLFLVGLPYLRAKAHDYFESLGGGLDADLIDDAPRRSLQSDNTLRSKMRSTFKALYPFCNTALEVWLLTYNIAYLFDKTLFYRPWLAWMGIDLRRAPAQPPALMIPPKLPSTFIERFKNLVRSSPRLLLESLRILLPLSVFFIKFLEWWYSPASPAKALTSAPSGPPIPPPKLLPPHRKGLAIDPTKFGQCPICRGSIVNATALPTGYLFCYKCIHPVIEQTGQCPVTLLKVHSWQLRKVLM